MIGLPGLPILPRLSLVQWLLAAALAVAAALLIALYGLQIKLPLIGWVGPEGVIAQRDEARAKVAAMISERKAAIAESERIARANADATEKADSDVTANLAQERAGADAFIAAGGVRRCPAARDNAPAAGQSPAVDAGAGAVPVVDDVPVVAVLPEDVLICTENTVKARAWQDWGLSIAKNSTP
jgi:hypothetical protein